jgi:negative regulator of sigma E activity
VQTRDAPLLDEYHLARHTLRATVAFYPRFAIANRHTALLLGNEQVREEQTTIARPSRQVQPR